MSRRFARAAELASFAAVILLLLVPTVIEVAGLVGALLWLGYRWLRRGSPIPVTPLNIAMLLLSAPTVVSLYLSPAPERAAVNAGQLVAGVLVLYQLNDLILTHRDVELAVGWLLGFGLLLACLSPLLLRSEPGKLVELRGIYGLAGQLTVSANDNMLAGGLAPLAPLGLALALSSQGGRRWLGLAAAAACVLAVIFLQSRGALFGLGLGIATWATLYRRWLLPFIPLAILGGLALNSVLGGPSPTQLLYGNIASDEYNSYGQRQEMWVQGVYLVRQSPWTGIGLGAYPSIAPTAWPHSSTEPGWDFPHVHNMFLQVALDTGILGAAGFFVLFAAVFLILARGYRLESQPHLAIGLIAALVVVLVHGLGDTIMWASKASLILWILFGIALKFDKKQMAM